MHLPSAQTRSAPRGTQSGVAEQKKWVSPLEPGLSAHPVKSVASRPDATNSSKAVLAVIAVFLIIQYSLPIVGIDAKCAVVEAVLAVVLVDAIAQCRHASAE